MVHFGQHAAGSEHLDQFGVVAQLLAGGAGALSWSVGEPELTTDMAEVGDPRGREAVQVSMTTRGGQRGAGGVDRRPLDGALLDRAGQVDTKAADLANRGEARLEAGPQAGHAPGRTQGDRLVHHVVHVH
jgi:hypothetical protein